MPGSHAPTFVFKFITVPLSFTAPIAIPLPEIRNRIDEIPDDKPIVVHCAGGYRSAAASSIINSAFNGKVKSL